MKRKSSRNCIRLNELTLKIQAQKREASLATTKFEYLTIKYLGFFSKDGNYDISISI